MSDSEEKYIYVIEQPLYDEIKNYIDSRPYNESHDLYDKVFDHDVENPVYTENVIHILLNYLRLCPRKEVAGMIKKMETHIKKYKHNKEPKDQVQS